VEDQKLDVRDGAAVQRVGQETDAGRSDVTAGVGPKEPGHPGEGSVPT